MPMVKIEGWEISDLSRAEAALKEASKLASLVDLPTLAHKFHSAAYICGAVNERAVRAEKEKAEKAEKEG